MSPRRIKVNAQKRLKNFHWKFKSIFLLFFVVQIVPGASNAEEGVCVDAQCDAGVQQADPGSDCTSHKEGAGVVQQTGNGKIPEEVVQKVQQAICDGNQYYAHLQAKDAYRLTLPTCINKSPLCAYWLVRGQCTSTEYQEFMAKECPLACQLCDAEPVQARAFLDFLFQNLTQAYQKGKQRNVVRDRRRALSTLMKALDMDPALLIRPLQKEDGNWLWTLHQRLMALIPPSMLKMYTGDPSRTDVRSLAAIHGLPEDTPPSQILPQTAVAYRHRGQIMNILAEPMDHLIIRPIQLGIAFAISNQDAINAIKSLDTPILEMGAGSGYWAALLRHNGIQVEAYDLHGTSKDHSFYDVWYTPDIEKGVCTEVLAQAPSLAPSHTLLLIWPNDPDPIDNPQFTSSLEQQSQPVWDAACLQAFWKAGGRQVIFVGERETVLQDKYETATTDSGISATRQFQTFLAEHYALQETIPIPTLWLNEDDLTIWKRKE